MSFVSLHGSSHGSSYVRRASFVTACVALGSLWVTAPAVQASAAASPTTSVATPAVAKSRPATKPAHASTPHRSPKRRITNGPSISYPSVVATDSPLVYYRLDESQGPTATDSSGNANNGTYSSSGVTYQQAGALVNDSDTAVSLSGSATVTSGAAPSIGSSQASTTEFWYRNASVSGNIDLLSSPGVQVRLTSSTNLCASGTTGSYSACLTLPYSIADGAWHLVDVQNYGNTPGCPVYLDARFVGTATNISGGGCGGESSVPLVVGDWEGGSVTTAGSFDEVAFYPSLLSASRIAARWTVAASHLNQTTLCAATPTSAYAARVLGNNPDVYLRLDDLAGDSSGRVAFDVSGHCATNAPSNGAYEPSDATSTNSALLNDANAAASVASDSVVQDTAAPEPTGSQASTTEFWYRSTQSASSVDLLTDAAVQVRLSGSTSLCGAGTTGAYSACVTLPYSVTDGAWHLIDVQNYGSSFGCPVYLDGSFVATAFNISGSGCGGNSSTPLLVGD